MAQYGCYVIAACRNEDCTPVGSQGHEAGSPVRCQREREKVVERETLIFFIFLSFLHASFLDKRKEEIVQYICSVVRQAYH